MTNERVNKISTLVPEVRKAFGVDSIALEPVALKGRVLNTPRTVEGSKVNNFVSKFYQPANTVTRWYIFLICSVKDEKTKEALVNFTAQLRKEALERGLKFAEKPEAIAPIVVKNPQDLVNTFAHLSDRKNAEIAFFGIPAPGKHSVPSAFLYNFVKNQGDREKGVMTQCFKAEYIFVSIFFSFLYEILFLFYQKQRPPNGYFRNFLLKVNAKLQGRNTVIEPTLLKQLPFNIGKTMMYGCSLTFFSI